MNRKKLTGTLLLSLCLTAGLTGYAKAEEKETLKAVLDKEGNSVSEFNYYDLPELPLEEELLETVLENENIRIERIISTGQTTEGWYDQEEHEYAVLLAGNARIEYDSGEKLDLAPGDTLLIPAHEKHRVSYTSEEPACIWLCIFWS